MEDENFIYNVETLIKRYPALKCCKDDINKAFTILVDCFTNGNKLLIAGNGGSCSDSEHIVGELMKGFKKRRPIDKEFEEDLIKTNKELGSEIATKLQKGFPVIALDSHQGLNTAFINDVKDGGLYTFAQQLSILGNKSDVFLGISTSGNSKNIINAAIVAKAKGMKVIGLTGEKDSKLSALSDITIKAPSSETFIVQEYHLPIYHCLCLMLEERFF
ncbi:MAG: SIS domain-containing protein [Bacilli bacterium]